MKRLENRQRMITYCDWCGKELECPYTILTFPDGTEQHFCSTYTSKIKKTCYDKYQKKQRYRTKAQS